MGTVTRSVPGCPVVSVSGSRQFPERASRSPPGPSRAARGPRPVQGASVGPALYPLGLLSTNEFAVCVWGGAPPSPPPPRSCSRQTSQGQTDRAFCGTVRSSQANGQRRDRIRCSATGGARARGTASALLTGRRYRGAIEDVSVSI